MVEIEMDAARAMRDVIRADLVVAGARTLDAIADAAEASLMTLTNVPHRISVARDARVPSLVRVAIAGPAAAFCVVIEP